MLKRYLPVGLMALGGLLLLASLAYWRYAEAVANPGELAVPHALAGEPLSDQVSGVDAVNDISGLHGKQFPLVSGARAVYGSGTVTLWVSGAPAAPMAAAQVEAMAERIAEGRSPFTPEGTLTVGRTNVFALSGLRQQHFYFQAGSLVIWLAADEALAEPALLETLEFYQGNGGE